MRRWAAVLLLAGCGAEDRGPVPIALGEDACAVCRMIVSEAPHAAQARFSPGEVECYDDIGCLGARLASGAEPRDAWVVDRTSGAWIDARTATYVKTKSVKTPMASGLVAFSSRAEAEKLEGEILSFEEVRSRRDAGR